MSIVSFIPIIGQLIDRIIPDKTEAAKAKAELDLLQANGELQLMLKQLDINIEEAKHSNLFVAGWRPAIGWCCGIIFAYHYLLYPIIITFSALNGIDPKTLPVFDTSSVIPVLGGLLGLGGLRTYEKIKGVARGNKD